MYCRVYNEHSEELSQEEVEEPQGAEEEVEQDLQEEEHQRHLPMSPNNQRNLLKMLK